MAEVRRFMDTCDRSMSAGERVLYGSRWHGHARKKNTHHIIASIDSLDHTASSMSAVHLYPTMLAKVLHIFSKVSFRQRLFGVIAH